MKKIIGNCVGYSGPNNEVYVMTENGNKLTLPVIDYETQEWLLENLFSISGIKYEWFLEEGCVTSLKRV